MIWIDLNEFFNFSDFSSHNGLACIFTGLLIFLFYIFWVESVVESVWAVVFAWNTYATTAFHLGSIVCCPLSFLHFCLTVWINHRDLIFLGTFCRPSNCSSRPWVLYTINLDWLGCLFISVPLVSRLRLWLWSDMTLVLWPRLRSLFCLTGKHLLSGWL